MTLLAGFLAVASGCRIRFTFNVLVDSVRGSRYCRVSVMSQKVSAPVLSSVAVVLYAGTEDFVVVDVRLSCRKESSMELNSLLELFPCLRPLRYQSLKSQVVFI